MVILFAHSQTPQTNKRQNWLYAGSSHLVLRRRVEENGMNIINDDITGRVHKDRKLLTATVLLQRMRWVNWRRRKCWRLRELIPVTL